ncbi:MAG: alanine racemase [Candidatus Eisenbacteria bacterium]
MGGSHASLDRLNIERPTLVLDRDRVLRNVERMAERAASTGVAFRPHFKTHQSLGVGRWFRDFGVNGITVSSVEMARYFAGDGWTDVTVASPVNLRELEAVAELAERVRLGVVVDSTEAVEALARRVTAKLRVWMKVDVGYGRAGVSWDDEALLSAVFGAVLGAAGLEFVGVLTHNGLVYHERTSEGVVRAHAQAMQRLGAAKALLASQGVGDCAISIGDTPSASLVDGFPGVDEIRPGNSVFYDLTQVAIGACSIEDIAVAVACPVIGVYPESGRALLYGGAVHLSLDSIEDLDGRTVFGEASLGWPGAATRDAPLVSLSQEHGVVAMRAGPSPDLARGGLVCVLPVHSCLTCNLHAEYVTLDEDRLGTIHTARGI